MANLFLEKKHKEQALAQRIAQHEMEIFNAEVNIATYQAFAEAAPEEAEAWKAKEAEEKGKIARIQIAIDIANRQLLGLSTGLAVK